MYYNLVEPLLQSTFRQCYLGCGSNRLCLKNSLGGEVSPHIHPSIIVVVLSYLKSSDIGKSIDTGLLVLRVGVWKIACEIDLWVVVENSMRRF